MQHTLTTQHTLGKIDFTRYNVSFSCSVVDVVIKWTEDDENPENESWKVQDLVLMAPLMFDGKVADATTKKAFIDYMLDWDQTFLKSKIEDKVLEDLEYKSPTELYYTTTRSFKKH